MDKEFGSTAFQAVIISREIDKDISTKGLMNIFSRERGLPGGSTRMKGEYIE